MRGLGVGVIWTTILLLSCNEAKFSGDTPRALETRVEQLAWALNCADATAPRTEHTGHAEVAAAATVRVSAAGELCADAAPSATVLLVVDMSGSMGRHRRTQDESVVDGNDPRRGDDCGRLAAARAVTQRLLEAGGAEPYAQIGMIPFAGDVLRERVIEPLPVAEFQERLTADVFCRHVPQSVALVADSGDAGAPMDARVDASTNYAAALQEARRMLQATDNGRVVYFISDGEPTAGGRDPARAGALAGAELRQLGADVVINGLLLGEDGARARDVMTSVTGASERVRLAAKADELAREVLLFPEIGFAPEGLTARLISRGPNVPEQERALKVAAWEPLSAGDHQGGSMEAKWRFSLEPFELPKAPRGDYEYRVEIRAEGLDGAPVTAELRTTITRM